MGGQMGMVRGGVREGARAGAGRDRERKGRGAEGISSPFYLVPPILLLPLLSFFVD